MKSIAEEKVVGDTLINYDRIKINQRSIRCEKSWKRFSDFASSDPHDHEIINHSWEQSWSDFHAWSWSYIFTTIKLPDLVTWFWWSLQFRAILSKYEQLTSNKKMEFLLETFVVGKFTRLFFVLSIFYASLDTTRWVWELAKNESKPSLRKSCNRFCATFNNRKVQVRKYFQEIPTQNCTEITSRGWKTKAIDQQKNLKHHAAITDNGSINNFLLSQAWNMTSLWCNSYLSPTPRQPATPTLACLSFPSQLEPIRRLIVAFRGLSTKSADKSLEDVSIYCNHQSPTKQAPLPQSNVVEKKDLTTINFAAI